MTKNIMSKDTPLAEITLRKYGKPTEDMSKREVIKKLCLSVGLLQPGDSRDVIVDIFHVMHESKEPLDSEEIQRRVVSYRKNSNLAILGIAPSNIRRQLRRLRELFLVEKVNNNYRLTENEKVNIIFEEKIKKFYVPAILARVEEYFKHLK